MTEAFGETFESSVTGWVVIRNSDRSLVKPLKATTATGTDEVKVNDPVIDAPPLYGVSFKNRAI